MSKRRDALRAMMAPIVMPPAEDKTGGAGEGASTTSGPAGVAQPGVAQATPASAPPASTRSAPAKSGSLKAMGLSLQGLTQEVDEARALRAQLAAGGQVIDLDPGVVDPSFIRDRIADERGDDDELQASIAEHGQLVPILVRPHPAEAGRYQVAYGHRRLEAVRRLGRPIRAVVRSLSDEELAVAQGKENIERRDLSFIERALFAARLEDRGFSRTALMAALGQHKGNLSTMIAVARSVPEPLILAIGPAPKVGRPRWEELAGKVRDSADAWRSVIASDGFVGLDSDARFLRLLKALTPKAPKSAPARVVTDDRGRRLAQVEEGRAGLRLTLDPQAAPDFGAYLVENLPEIYAAFLRRQDV